MEGDERGLEGRRADAYEKEGHQVGAWSEQRVEVGMRGNEESSSVGAGSSRKKARKNGRGRGQAWLRG